ncbi:recombinase RecT [Chromobacterium subtsugae]|uniref:recombinase RecT n=1 Tax=Chromobacterium subtsugae TaxID=251747 RepID=UPI0006412CB8|nr:recombinase RecT [Chromobacterium subtsugae]
MSTALTALTGQLAQRLNLGGGEELLDTLKQTAFKGQVTNAQMTALLIVANQYGLNPWTKEIYAFPDKNGGIVPVVGVDGWARIINEHPQFDGMDFEVDDKSCTCVIYRKDRTRAVRITEYMDECKKSGSGPWQSHPRRMLRHRAMIQCARLAFGFGGISDEDDADRIREKDITPQVQMLPKELEPYPTEKFAEMLEQWKGLIEAGRCTADDIISKIKSRNTLSDQQESILRACEPVGETYENA